MIEAKALFAGYGGKEVLHGISARFEAGRITGIIGPNGCGKSTFLKTLAGLLPAQAGEVLVDGVPLGRYQPHELAQRLAYLPQSRNVPGISALRMVLHGRFAYLSYPRRYREADLAAAREALRWAGAEELADQSLQALSGGQRQKIYIAMALAQDTGVVLMDEPTTYLDVKNQHETMALARRLAQMGKAVVLVLHDLDLVLRHADEVLLLHKGSLAAHGAPADVYAGGGIEACFGVRLRVIETPDGPSCYTAPL